MAVLVPSVSPVLRRDGGIYRELDIVNQLVQALPDGYEIFHGLELHTVQQGHDHYGEIDIIVLAPTGALLIIEVKAGAVQLRDGQVFKCYGTDERTRDVSQQVRWQRGSLLSRLSDARLETSVANCLVLPDYRLSSDDLVSMPRERIIDATLFPQLASLVREWLAGMRGCTQFDALRRFLYNQFRVTVDLAAVREQLARSTRVLADGLATWVPRIEAPSRVLRVQATAGSGKTQLALQLLEQALQAGGRAGYVCFNRSLADHIRALAPARAEVANFHELVVEYDRRTHGEPDFTQPQVLEQATARYLAASGSLPSRYDLLVIDEGQDFEPEWIERLVQLLHPDGKLYLLQDDEQRLYARQDFAIDDAVVVVSRDNFRSPRLICDVINALRLCSTAVVSKSPYQGELPGFHVYRNEPELLEQTAQAVAGLMARGFAAGDIAVVSHRGRAASVFTERTRIGALSTTRFTGAYTRAGEPVWSQGELLVESIYRFKGQSKPAIVLTEVAFAELTAVEKRKLFVGLTRAQMAVEIVLSPEAEQAMMGVIDAAG